MGVKSGSSITCAFLSLFLIGDVFAQDATQNPTLANDWFFSLGTACTISDPRVGLGTDESSTVLIDLETLGLDGDDNDYYVHAHWQGLNRWRFSCTTFLSAADGGRFTDQDYTFGDLTIPAGSGVSIDTKAQFYVVNAHYALWQKPRWDTS